MSPDNIRIRLEYLDYQSATCLRLGDPKPKSKMTSHDILFETDRFNLSDVKPHFINPCCFGEDVAFWLRERLSQHGVEADEPGQEDWGWYTGATLIGATYFIGIGGNIDEVTPRKNYGEWRIAVERRRSLWDRLTGRNKMTPDDPMVALILKILETEPGFASVRQETADVPPFVRG